MNTVVNNLRKHTKSLIDNERGAVGIYIGLIAFLVVTVSCMILDISRISQDKMQMQAAADSAALEMAVWEARGMNIVQNLNNEIYWTDTACIAAYEVALTMTLAADVLVAAGEATAEIGGEILVAAGEALELAAAVLGYVVKYLHQFYIGYYLDNLRGFYVYASKILGWISANRVAHYNGAEPLGGYVPTFGDGGDNLLIKFLKKTLDELLASTVVAIGIPTPGEWNKYIWRLPLDKKGTEEDPGGSPTNVSEESSTTGSGTVVFGTIAALVEANEDLEGDPGDFAWDDGWWESAEKDKQIDGKVKEAIEKLLEKYKIIKKFFGGSTTETENPDSTVAPMIWFVAKKRSGTLVSEYFLNADVQSKKATDHIWAYAVGMAVCGKVTKHNNKMGGKGHGVQGDAILVPANSLSPLGLGVKEVFMH